MEKVRGYCQAAANAVEGGSFVQWVMPLLIGVSKWVVAHKFRQIHKSASGIITALTAQKVSGQDHKLSESPFALITGASKAGEAHLSTSFSSVQERVWRTTLLSYISALNCDANTTWNGLAYVAGFKPCDGHAGNECRS